MQRDAGPGYRARESVLHTLAEQDAWLRRHCEAAAAVDAEAEPAAEEAPAHEAVAGGAALESPGP